METREYHAPRNRGYNCSERLPVFRAGSCAIKKFHKSDHFYTP